MSDQVLQALLDYGSRGLFSGFLAWQFLQMQKRLDGLVESFQSQVREINDDFDTRVEKMRQRYAIVINDIRKDCRENEARLQSELKIAHRELLDRERQSVIDLKSQTD